MSKLCLYFINFYGQEGVFTAMVDFLANNSFVYSEVFQKLHTATVDVPAMRVTLADGSYINYSIAVSLYLKLCGNLQ